MGPDGKQKAFYGREERGSYYVKARIQGRKGERKAKEQRPTECDMRMCVYGTPLYPCGTPFARIYAPGAGARRERPSCVGTAPGTAPAPSHTPAPRSTRERFGIPKHSREQPWRSLSNPLRRPRRPFCGVALRFPRNAFLPPAPASAVPASCHSACEQTRLCPRKRVLCVRVASNTRCPFLACEHAGQRRIRSSFGNTPPEPSPVR